MEEKDFVEPQDELRRELGWEGDLEPAPERTCPRCDVLANGSYDAARTALGGSEGAPAGSPPSPADWTFWIFPAIGKR